MQDKYFHPSYVLSESFHHTKSNHIINLIMSREGWKQAVPKAVALQGDSITTPTSEAPGAKCILASLKTQP